MEDDAIGANRSGNRRLPPPHIIPPSPLGITVGSPLPPIPPAQQDTQSLLAIAQEGPASIHDMNPIRNVGGDTFDPFKLAQENEVLKITNAGASVGAGGGAALTLLYGGENARTTLAQSDAKFAEVGEQKLLPPIVKPPPKPIFLTPIAKPKPAGGAGLITALAVAIGFLLLRK
jgi:hypothetical protein